MKSFAIVSVMNDYIGFVVTVSDKNYKAAKGLSITGFDMWNDPLNFSAYESSGYSEPSSELMAAAGIKHAISEYYDEHGNVLEEFEGIEEVVV